MVLVVPGCNLLVSVPAPGPVPGVKHRPKSLTAFELLSYSIANLSEVEPGLLYRSAQPDGSLIRFLGDRVNLRHVVTLRGSATGEELEAIDAIGATLTRLRMTVRRPPTPEQILEIIRITQLARSRGESMLFHCKAGADRTGAMVGIWRQLFQNVDDIGALNREAFLLRNLPAFVPMTRETIFRFQRDLFIPFLENPALLDDEERIAEFKKRYFENQPLLSGQNQVTEGPLRAGTSKTNLLTGLEFPIQMATYGPFPGKAESVREPVFARVVFLDNGKTRLAVVSCDLMTISSALRQRVLERLDELGAGVDDILLAATHAHTSVGGYVDHSPSEIYILGDFDKKIEDHLVYRMSTAVAEAAANAQDASIGAARTFVADLNFNRRLGTTVDDEVGVIKISDVNGDPIAVIVNFSAHPILEPDDQISSDFPGYLSAHLDTTYGFGMFLNGALGDLNPLVGGRETWREEGAAAEFAGAVANAVEDALRRIEPQREIHLGSMTSLVTLPPANVRMIPDLLFPIDCLVTSFLDWPQYTEVQSIRIGDVALIGTASEIGVRLGLQIKRRSPTLFPFIVTHANGYAGYALTATGHSRGCVDPSSMVALNGPQHGPRVVEQACDLLEAQFGKRLDPQDRLLSPAGEARVDISNGAGGSENRQTLREEAITAEESAAYLDEDPTQPQTRRADEFGLDSSSEFMRLEFSQLFLSELRGGQRLGGRKLESKATLNVELPWELRLSASTGYVRSDWRNQFGTLDRSEGILDVETRLRRSFCVYANNESGKALRLTPEIGYVLPTGDHDALLPYAFSASTGVWRPAVGLGIEWNWNVYRTLAAEARFYGATNRRNGRQPGELIETALRYTERLGVASLLLDLTSTLQMPDRRQGGRLSVDVAETSYDVSIRPGLSLHLGDHVDLIGQYYFPVAKSGNGAPGAEGGRIGLVIGF
jgi:hypothetical protein